MDCCMKAAGNQVFSSAVKNVRQRREKKKGNSRRLLQLLFFDFSFCNLKKKNLLLKSVFIGFLNSFGDRFNRFVDHVG
ncbi:hypothetical protein AAC387_Pa09g2231 [Persea americana]